MLLIINYRNQDDERNELVLNHLSIHDYIFTYNLDCNTLYVEHTLVSSTFDVRFTGIDSGDWRAIKKFISTGVETTITARTLEDV